MARADKMLLIGTPEAQSNVHWIQQKKQSEVTLNSHGTDSGDTQTHSGVLDETGCFWLA